MEPIIIKGINRKALVLGGTGLVGSSLLDQLLKSGVYSRIISVSRRPPELEHPLITSKRVDFRDLEKNLRQMLVDDIYCCLGTTMKQAGSKEAFRRVDLEYPLLAASTLHHCAEHFLLVSALGANEKSPLFYNRIKGELEQSLLALQYPFTTIARPSLLLGERKESRMLEGAGVKIVNALTPMLPGPLKKLAGVDALRVAAALLNQAQSVVSGKRTKPVEILDSAVLQRACVC